MMLRGLTLCPSLQCRLIIVNPATSYERSVWPTVAPILTQLPDVSAPCALSCVCSSPAYLLGARQDLHLGHDAMPAGEDLEAGEVFFFFFGEQAAAPGLLTAKLISHDSLQLAFCWAVWPSVHHSTPLQALPARLLQELYQLLPLGLSPVLGNPIALAAKGIPSNISLPDQVSCDLHPACWHCRCLPIQGDLQLQIGFRFLFCRTAGRPAGAQPSEVAPPAGSSGQNSARLDTGVEAGAAQGG